jgi:hypothetical protein
MEKTTQEAVELCLECGNPGTKKKPLKMGLCPTDYPNFLRTLNDLPISDRAGFEEFLIKKKKLLPRKKSGPKTTNPFAGYATEYLKTKMSREEREDIAGMGDALSEPDKSNKE